MKTLDQMTLTEMKVWKPGIVDFAVIQEMAWKIAEELQPERIILFGSHARGEANDRSDVDLLVIAASDEPPPHRSVPIYRLLRNYLVALDILVRTPEEIAKYALLPYSTIGTALREGVTLYERKN